MKYRNSCGRPAQLNKGGFGGRSACVRTAKHASSGSLAASSWCSLEPVQARQVQTRRCRTFEAVLDSEEGRSWLAVAARRA